MFPALAELSLIASDIVRFLSTKSCKQPIQRHSMRQCVSLLALGLGLKNDADYTALPQSKMPRGLASERESPWQESPLQPMRDGIPRAAQRQHSRQPQATSIRRYEQVRAVELSHLPAPPVRPTLRCFEKECIELPRRVVNSIAALARQRITRSRGRS